MKTRKIEVCRDENGFINLNKLVNFREKGEVVEGSHAKSWYNVDGVRFLFKEYDDVLPTFGEVLYSRIANKCGVRCAEYDFACSNGKVGTISYDFLDEHSSYYNFLELTTQFCDTKFTLEEIVNDKGLLVIHDSKYNNLTTICGVLEEIFNINEEERFNIEMELVKMFCLDTMFLHADRRLWNYGIIVDELSDEMGLAPSHDNSHVLCLQKGKKYIEKAIYSLINGERIDLVINFTLSNREGDTAIKQLVDYYANSRSDVREKIEKVVSCVNVDEEVETLKMLCKIDDVSTLWIKAVLNYRQSTILNELESVKIMEEDIPRRPNVNSRKKK